MQGRIMMVAGIGFTIAAILVLDRHTGLIRGFAGPAVLIVLALCGYGANLMFSRPAEINQFVVAYEADAAAFRVSEKQRFLDLRTSFAPQSDHLGELICCRCHCRLPGLVPRPM